jgi:hypothetical protein
MTWRFVTEPSFSEGGHRLYIANDRPDGSRDIVTRIELTRRGPDEYGPILDPIVPPREVHDFLRAAMNAAWELGIRPDGFNDTRESMAATKAHLADMRTLTFRLIDAQMGAAPVEYHLAERAGEVGIGKP